MDLFIPEEHKLAEKEVSLDNLPLASSYAKDATLNQRKRINEIILANMDKSCPAIELPFTLFFEIEQEMKDRGWYKNDGGWYHPIWFIERDAEVEIMDEENKVISAEVFYNSTMKQQLMELHTEIEKEREKGLSRVQLKFPLYKVIIDKLAEQGWHVYVNNRFSRSAQPYTFINPAKF